MTPNPQRTFERPHRPLPVRVVNSIGSMFRGLGLYADRLTEASILATARRRTKLSDFGDETFREPLRRLIQSCREDAQLNTIGRLIMRDRLVELAENRLRIEESIQRHPEILDEQIRRPLLVTGLPRTGTTLLYKLLSEDPAGRPLMFWETYWPAPLASTQMRGTDPRIKRARTMAKRAHWIAPQLQAVHALDPDGPEECLNLTFHTFASPGFLMLADLPGYEEWLEQLRFEEKVHHYRYYRRQLQLLQWQHSGDHWVLKSPVHLAALDALLTVFPDACVVQTHRDPAKAIPSVCSLFAILRSMSTDALDPHRLGSMSVEICAELLDRASHARDSKPDRIYNVHYAELVKDPIAAVRGIYDYFGYEYGDALEARLKAWLDTDARVKRPTHRYDLAQFGLDTATIDRLFGAYCERYDVAHEVPRC